MGGEVADLRRRSLCLASALPDCTINLRQQVGSDETVTSLREDENMSLLYDRAQNRVRTRHTTMYIVFGQEALA